MACFTVTAVAAIGTAVARHIVKHNEKKNDLTKVEPIEYKFGSEVKWSKKLGYLELALFSGSFVLALEHILHGEVVPYPPFLTAAGEGAEAVTEMLTEMGTVGVAMLGIIAAAWAIGVLVVDFFKFKKHKESRKATVVK